MYMFNNITRVNCPLFTAANKWGGGDDDSKIISPQIYVLAPHQNLVKAVLTMHHNICL